MATTYFLLLIGILHCNLYFAYWFDGTGKLIMSRWHSQLLVYWTILCFLVKEIFFFGCFFLRIKISQSPKVKKHAGTKCKVLWMNIRQNSERSNSYFHPLLDGKDTRHGHWFKAYVTTGSASNPPKCRHPILIITEVLVACLHCCLVCCFWMKGCWTSKSQEIELTAWLLWQWSEFLC